MLRCSLRLVTSSICSSTKRYYKTLSLENSIRPVIGLEFHVQIASSTKLFSDMTSDYFGSPPNTLVAPFDIGLPGTLPVLNVEPVILAVKTALALNCVIPTHSTFDRKHYFYPDLANGFQITQNFNPLAKNGFIKLGLFEGYQEDRIIGIQQIHIEQDTAKAIYDSENFVSLDFNRSGMPLMEIVTGPDIKSPEEAGELVKYLQELLVCIGTSHASLETGSLRIDANISLKGEKWSTHRVEIKNIATITGLVNALYLKHIFTHVQIPQS
ncbi:hypothetical protein HMI56_001087 [Coelomomyces lativittatus]|nr:hypothetical protein HMI56_001087 [Coelomomyces lativittatus]